MFESTPSLCESCGVRLALLTRTPALLDLRSSHLSISRSNQLLSSDDVMEKQNLVAEAEIELSTYDTEIIRLKATLDQLLHKRRELHQCVQETQALLVPVRRLPPEILSLVISLSLPKKWHVEKSGAIALPHSQVSTYWREVALSMKELWSPIRLNLPPRKHSLAILQAYLWRSDNASLTLALCESQAGARKQSPETSYTMVDLIATHSFRWKNVDLTLSPMLFRRLSSVRGRLQRLETLKLGVPYQVFTRDLLHRDFDMFAEAPKLSTLHIANPLVPSLLQIPWRQVTHYSASSVTEHLPDLLQILPQLPDLVSLRIEPVYGTQSLGRIPRGSILLSNLKELMVVGQSDAVTVGRLISALSIPSVAMISLQYLPMRALTFVRWLSESTSSITTLDLCYLADLTSSTLIQCLEATPSLVTFTYKERVGEPIIWTTDVSQRLTIQNPVSYTTQPHLLPQLKRMTLSFIRSELDVDDLLRMVESRWRVQSKNRVQTRLHSLQVEFRFPHTPSTYTAFSKLKEFEREGLCSPS